MDRKKNNLAGNKIIIRGARVNNLKNIDIDISRDKFVVVTGLSGSGKSSLAFDVIYAEGNRRYMEILSSYARSILDVSSKPDLDKIEGLSPAISIDQKSVARSPRSTVGTLTEIYDYLRIFFAKIGVPHCPECGQKLERKTAEQILNEIIASSSGKNIIILSNQNRKEKNAREILKSIQQMGYARVCFGGKIITVAEALMISSDEITPDIDIVVDRIKFDYKNPDRERIMDSIKTALKLGKGSIIIVRDENRRKYNQNFVCADCGIAIKDISPRHFSFNSPEGACPRCQGLGEVMDVDPDLVIPNKKLSLAEGAVRPWGKLGGKTFMIGRSIIGENGLLPAALAKKYNFSLDTPLKNFSAQQLKVLLYGEEDKKLEEKILSNQDMGGIRQSVSFSGIINDLLKKYHQTQSEYIKSEIEKYMLSRVCPICEGRRIKKEYLSVLVDGKSIYDFSSLSVAELKKYLDNFSLADLSSENKKVASEIIQEVVNKLKALKEVGLDYLSLNRSTQTISGGESQRIRLAVQIKSHLMGVLYVLDEPSIGLHSRDTEKLIKTLQFLRDAGNFLIVVEHDRDFIKKADWIIDMGPGAGEAGGKIIFQGTPSQLLKSKSDTAQYISGKKKAFLEKKFGGKSKKYLEIIGAAENNLKNIKVKLPLEKFIAVCGVSGSGKSTLVNDILAKALSKHFYKSKAVPGKHKSINGLQYINKVINITQDPIGRTPRSNAATYTGVFSHIRQIFSETPEARERKYSASRFSFNMKGGRCEVCRGEGMKKIEMRLLPDMYVKCDSCEGTRYNRKTLEIEYQGANIADVLEMSVSYALKFFKRYPLIKEKLQTLENVGLGYLKLGQSATTLSGGEAQRIKLATELARKSTGKTLYILDEPTIGLHFGDTRRLLEVLQTLTDKGNTVLVVEHNLDVIKSADWVIELGPEGGNAGGKIVFEGTPKKMIKSKKTWTAKYL